MNILNHALIDIFKLKFENILGWGAGFGMVLLESIPSILAIIAPLTMLGVSAYVKLDSHRKEQKRKKEAHDLEQKIRLAENIDKLVELDEFNNKKEEES